MHRYAQVAKNVDETKEAKKEAKAEEKSPWKDLSTAIMEERWVEEAILASKHKTSSQASTKLC